MQSIATEKNILNNNEMTKYIAYYSIIGKKDKNFKAGKCYVIFSIKDLYKLPGNIKRKAAIKNLLASLFMLHIF